MTQILANAHNAINRIIGNNTTSHGSEREISLSLQAGTLQGASNGSMTHNTATQAWSIEPQQTSCLSQHCIEGVGPVDGEPHILDSITLERGGFLGLLYTAYQLAHKYNFNQGVITMRWPHCRDSHGDHDPEPPACSCTSAPSTSICTNRLRLWGRTPSHVWVPLHGYGGG